MSEQAAAATEQQQGDTPVEGTAAQSTPAIPDGYVPEDRYKEAQAWGTRLAQEKVELEARAQVVADLESDDPERNVAALRKLGYNVPEPEPQDTQPAYELDPEIRAKLAKVDEIDQWRQTQTQTQQQEQHYTQYREQFDPRLKELGVPDAFVQNVADIAYNQLDAIQTPQGPQPDLEGAVAQFMEVAEMFADVPHVQQKVKKTWANGKPRSAFTQAGGAEAMQALDLTKHENRVGIAMSRLNTD